MKNRRGLVQGGTATSSSLMMVGLFYEHAELMFSSVEGILSGLIGVN